MQYSVQLPDVSHLQRPTAEALCDEPFSKMRILFIRSLFLFCSLFPIILSSFSSIYLCLCLSSSFSLFSFHFLPLSIFLFFTLCFLHNSLYSSSIFFPLFVFTAPPPPPSLSLSLSLSLSNFISYSFLSYKSLGQTVRMCLILTNSSVIYAATRLINFTAKHMCLSTYQISSTSLGWLVSRKINKVQYSYSH